MKNTATTTAIMDKKALEYLSTISPFLVKRSLYAMTLLKADQQLNDSRFHEVQRIAAIYDGYVIYQKEAKELATKLAKAYAQQNPHVLITKKELDQYTHVEYRKLREAVGVYGFDYVLETLRYGKAYVNRPDSGISEKDMLRALRWVEQREGYDKENSNIYHHKKGLELLGFDQMENELLDYTFIIANVYELITPNNDMTEFTTYSPTTEEIADFMQPSAPLSVREMKIHFIEKAALIQDFYGTHKPTLPEGYSEELVGDSTILNLASKGLLKDSEAVLAYVNDKNGYDAIMTTMTDEFSEEELAVIREQPEKVQALISNEW